MKKYFFLLFLFIIYLVILLNNNDTKYVNLNQNIDNHILDITLNFDSGINSNDLNKIFSEYNKEYYIKEISLSDEKIELSCDSFLVCVIDIFELKDDNFYNKYIVNGFKIKNINFITYKDDIISFLDNKKINYTIN